MGLWGSDEPITASEYEKYSSAVAQKFHKAIEQKRVIYSLYEDAAALQGPLSHTDILTARRQEIVAQLAAATGKTKIKDREQHEAYIKNLRAERDKIAKLIQDNDKEELESYVINELFRTFLKYCIYLGTPDPSAQPNPILIKTIINARKGMSTTDRSKLLADFLWTQLHAMRQISLLVDRKATQELAKSSPTGEGKIIFRALNQEDMNRYVDHIIQYMGPHNIDKATVYTTINNHLHNEDTGIIQERSAQSISRSELHSSLEEPLTDLKKELLKSQPSSKKIRRFLNKFANYRDPNSTLPPADQMRANLSKLIIELQNEPFMINNGFARAMLYNQLYGILIQYDEKEIDEHIDRMKPFLNWYEKILRFIGYEKYRYMKVKEEGNQSGIARFSSKVSEDAKLYDIPVDLKEMNRALNSAKIVNKRNGRGSRVRPALLALSSLTMLIYAGNSLFIHYAIGITAATFFGFAIFSNPFVLPAIMFVIASISLARTLYHMYTKSKMNVDREIMIEHESSIYHDYDVNPNTKPKTRMESVKHFFARMVNSLPVLCAVMVVGLVLNLFVPGFLDFAAALDIPSLFRFNVGWSMAATAISFAIPTVIFAVTGGIGSWLRKYGYKHDSNFAIVAGDVLAKTAKYLTFAYAGAGAFFGIAALFSWMGVAIPVLPALVGILTTLTGVLILGATVASIQLYTNIMDTRSQKEPPAQNDSTIGQELYSLHKRSEHTGLENKTTPSTMPGLANFGKTKVDPSKEPAQTNVNTYYRLPGKKPSHHQQ